MKKTLYYGWKILQLSWKANGINALIVPLNTIYSNTLYPLILMLLVAHVLNLLSKMHSLNIEQIWWMVVIYVVAYFISITLDSYVSVKQPLLDAKLYKYIDLTVAEKLASLDPATFEDAIFQEKLIQVDGIKGTIDAQLDRYLGLINAVVRAVSAALVLLPTFPVLILLIAVATIPYQLAWHSLRNKSFPFFREERSGLLRVVEYVKYLLANDSAAKETAIFNTKSVLVGKLNENWQSYINRFTAAIGPSGKAIFAGNLYQLAVIVIAQFVNLRAVLRGQLPIGQFALYFQQITNLGFGIGGIFANYSSTGMRTKYINQYFEFLDTKPLLTNSMHPTSLPKNPFPPTIEFHNVSFHYPGTTRKVLQDFNLVVRPGEKVALVGENGAGKTTIIKLLLRFYDVTDGDILLNGLNIKDIDLKEWYKLLGALFQDFIRYQFTYKENVYYGNIARQHDRQLLTKAIQQSGANTILKKLPNGLEQVVGKRFHEGLDLSGGQWQKLALARAFYRDAPILILDEPTSAIDAKAEYEIFQRVQHLEKQKTVIIISHRFSTVRNADRILVLDQGSIIEEGTHEQLMKKKGLYEELFTIQAKGYK